MLNIEQSWRQKCRHYFSTQGFKEGMENLYNPITDSIKAFSYDVSLAPAPILTDMYGG